MTSDLAGDLLEPEFGPDVAEAIRRLGPGDFPLQQWRRWARELTITEPEMLAERQRIADAWRAGWRP